MNNLGFEVLLSATWQTVYMVAVSGTLSILFGLFFGTLLFITRSQYFSQNLLFNRMLGTIMNMMRSIPFIILMILIIPFTRLLMGTSIGTDAAIVPLTLAAIPLFARITESAFLAVPIGLLEVAISMGSNHWQTIYKVLIPEGSIALVRGATLTIISLIGYSAMAGAVGGGGLGELAINYGYQRFDTQVMFETVITLMILVNFVQWFGDYVTKQHHIKIHVISFLIFFFTCITTHWIINHTQQAQEELKIGVVSGPQEQIMNVVKAVAKKRYDLNLKIVIFNDYLQPNIALDNGSIDANIFQHIPYLDAQKKQHHLHITTIGKTYVYPMGFYSKKLIDIKNLPEKSIVAIPNDPSNEARALLILQKAGLIQLKPGSGLTATPYDIISNPKALQFKSLDAAELVRTFSDADLVALTNDYIHLAGFKTNQALLLEDKDSLYANVIAIRENEEHKKVYQELVEAIHSPEVQAETKKLFPNGAAITAW